VVEQGGEGEGTKIRRERMGKVKKRKPKKKEERAVRGA
jgi:hypothetical protein